MKVTLNQVIVAIIVVVLGYMVYTHFLSRSTMVKAQKIRTNNLNQGDELLSW